MCLLKWCKVSGQFGIYDNVIKWKHFPRYWPFVRGIHRSPVNSPHKGQWRGVLMFSLICVWINGWVNNREAGDLRHYGAHYDDIVMITCFNGVYLLDFHFGSSWYSLGYGIMHTVRLYRYYSSNDHIPQVLLKHSRAICANKTGKSFM